MATPQRYAVNYDRYKKRGGLLQPETLIEDFVADNEANQRDLSRFYFFCLAFDQIVKEGVSGDLAELGIYKGSTAALLVTMARHLDATAYLLDTFTGFDGKDLAGIDEGKRLEFIDTSIDAIRARLGDQNVRLIPGHFPETASQLPADARFSLVHLDCDLYKPMAAALEYFYPRLAPGGFLIVHDYLSYHWEGVERAVDEFFADKPEPIIPVPDGAGTVAIRKVRVAHRFANWYVQSHSPGFANMWAKAGDDGLADILEFGWSNPEDWGVWGVGERHALWLVPSAAPAGDIVLDVDAQAVLLGPRTSQQVEVLVGADRLATWEFTAARNRDVRSVRVPLAALATEEGKRRPGALIEFRPASVESPHDLDASVADTRQLGLGVYRIRLRSD